MCLGAWISTCADSPGSTFNRWIWSNYNSDIISQTQISLEFSEISGEIGRVRVASSFDQINIDLVLGTVYVHLVKNVSEVMRILEI